MIQNGANVLHNIWKLPSGNWNENVAGKFFITELKLIKKGSFMLFKSAD